MAAANKRKDNPSNEPRGFETAVSGVVKIPIKLASTDSFNAQTKVKLYGHAAVAKIKEITIDPKKKNALEIKKTKEGVKQFGAIDPTKTGVDTPAGGVNVPE